MMLKQFTIYGRVQGVAFRFYTLQQARKLGLKGYVKNLAEGSVLVLAQGNEQQLAELQQWLKQGSPAAQVREIVVQQLEREENFAEFRVEY